MSTVEVRRVYARPHARIPLDDAGFLSASLLPFAGEGAFAGPEDLVDLPWFALVGEPGTGKTLELRSLAKRSGARLVDLGRHNRLADIAGALSLTHSTDTTGAIRLCLDALDESLTHAGDVAREVVDWVRALSDQERARLRLGIACRTGAWPTWLGDELDALLRPADGTGPGAPSKVFELLPLSRADARALIEDARGSAFDSAGFIARHVGRGLGHLLARPKTLQALLDVNGDVEDRWQLYESTLRRACLESRQRQTRPHREAWPQARRYALLERIAAAMLLTSRVHLRRSEREAPEPDELLVEDLAEAQGVPLDGAVLAPAAVRAALVSEPLPLQEGRTDDHLLFQHRTDAEFLAASFLSRQLGARDVLEGPDGHVHPQLAELAGWLAVRDRNVREWLMSTDPEALLLGDTAVFTPAERERLVEALLCACRDGMLADHVGGWENHLGRLDHERLPEQLTGWLVSGGDFVARRVAIEIGRVAIAEHGPAARSGWGPFLDRLAEIALDRSEPDPLRIRAASALERTGDRERIARLRPLLDWARGDADGELAGITLRGLWKERLVDASEMFRALVPPRAGFAGAYAAFLRYTLPKDLPASVLAPAMAWIREHVTDHDDERDWFNEHFGKGVLTEAWRNQHDPQIADALLHTVATLLRRHLSAPLDAEAVREDDSRRRAAIRALVTRTDVYPFQFARVTGLVTPSDVLWLLDWHTELADRAVRQRVRQLAWTLLDFTDALIADRALVACGEDADLAAEWGLLRPVALDDPAFEHLRSQARRDATKAERRIDGELWIGRHLEAIPESPHRFYNLMYALTVNPETGREGDPLNSEPTSWPGWVSASTERQERIREAAATFLVAWHPDPGEWGRGKGVQSLVFAGGWALELVAERPVLEARIPDERLAEWALAYLWHCARDREEGGPVCALFARRIPGRFVEALARVVEACGESHEAARAVRRAASGWSAIEAWITAALERGDLPAEVDSAALQALAAARPDRALEMAWARLERGELNELLLSQTAEFLFRAMRPAAFWRWWPLASNPAPRLRGVVESYAHRRYWGERDDSGLERFAADALACLLRALLAAYPPEDDPDHRGRFHAVSPSDDAIRLRDAISSVLVERASSDDIRALASLAAEFPARGFRWSLVRARQTARRRAWVPLTPRALWTVLAGEGRTRVEVDGSKPVSPVEKVASVAGTLRPLRILQISDLHERTRYAGMPARRLPVVELDEQERGLVLGDRFYEAIAALVGPGIDLVCFTGDVADWGRPEELAAAGERVRRILQVARVPPERFFAVPGNHDVQRGLESAAWRRLRAWQAQAETTSALGRWLRGAAAAPAGLRTGDREKILIRTAAFWDWLREVRGDDLRGAGTRLGYRRTLPVGTWEHVPVPVHVIGLDSAWSCGSDDDPTRILVTGEQVLDHTRDGRDGLRGFRLALVHHPLEQLADQQEVRRRLADDGVDLLLRGHQHEPMAATVSEPDSALPVLAAGCLMEGAWGRTWPNGFNLVEVDLPAGECRVRFRKWSRDGGFWAPGTDLYRTARGDQVVLKLRRSY